MLATAPKRLLYNQEIFKVRWVLSVYRCLINSGLRLRSEDKGDRFLPPPAVASKRTAFRTALLFLVKIPLRPLMEA